MADRHNPVLDDFMSDVERVEKAKRRRRKTGLNKDQIRRLAFRVLAAISKYDGPTRRRVLDQAIKVNEA